MTQHTVEEIERRRRRASKDSRSLSGEAGMTKDIQAYALLLLVALVGLVISVQGWKSHVPYLDLVVPIDDAIGFLQHGRIPEWGRGNSLGSYSPPGSFWLLVPGAALVSDPRLFEIVGAGVLHVLTLVGVFLLARSLFGTRCASLSVVLYGLSELGLYFAGSLWPIGNPFFYVWMLFFAARWVQNRDPISLAAAIVTCSAGMCVHLVFGAAFLILPILWLVYRPPIRVVPLAVGLALVFLTWLPYLRFEYSRGFSDVTSQLLLKGGAHGGDYRKSWCDPSLAILKVRDRDRHRRAQSSWSDTWTDDQHTLGLEAGLFGNFSRNLRIEGVQSVLLGLTVAGLILLGLVAKQSADRFRRATGPMGASQYRRRETDKELGPELLLIFVLVPWIILIFATLNAQYLATTRLWWIWPGQVVVLSATLTYIPEYFKVRLAIVYALQALVVALVVLNPVLISRIQSGLSTGWSGADSDEKRVVDFIADEVGSGRQTAAIGYQTFFYGWMRSHSTLDPRIKVGMEFDLLFRTLHNLTNTNKCPEGISPNDEFRVVQYATSLTMAPPFASAQAPQSLFDPPTDDRFYLLRHIGRYSVLKRNVGAAQSGDFEERHHHS